MWFTRKTKNTITFLSISLAFIKPEISANFFQIKWSVFRISLGYCLSQFSQVIVLFQLSRKSQNEKFLEFFQLFAVFIKIEKCRLFSLSPFGLLDWQLSKNGAKWNSRSVWTFCAMCLLRKPWRSLLHWKPCSVGIIISPSTSSSSSYSCKSLDLHQVWKS